MGRTTRCLRRRVLHGHDSVQQGADLWIGQELLDPYWLNQSL